MRFLQYVLGALAVIIILVLIVSAVATAAFNQMVERETNLLLKTAPQQSQLVTVSELQGLPGCVQKWLKTSQVVGKERIRTVRVKQTGSMRTQPDTAWMPFQAQYVYTTDQPGFIWYARVKAAPLIYLLGRDKYYQGEGSMLIKLLGVVDVANEQGKEIDQGTLLRFLAEMMWYPSAALNPYIEWEEIDRLSARAAMNYQGVNGSGVFRFNEQGDVVEFRAERPRAVDGRFEMTPWIIPVKDHRVFDGVRIPSSGEVIWELDNGEFNWFHFKTLEVEYNRLQS